jgi:hypothetical protein
MDLEKFFGKRSCWVPMPVLFSIGYVDFLPCPTVDFSVDQKYPYSHIIWKNQRQLIFQQ